jgi:hypothetical protein
MSIFKIGTKIQAVLSVAFLLVVSLSSIFALQITYSDTGVTYDVAGIISNSKGHYWAATGANIQTAIWDLNGTGGYVQLPATEIHTIKELNMMPTVWLKGCGNSTIIYQDSAGTFSFGALKCYNIDNFTISDLAIYGNQGVLGTNGYNAIDVYGSSDFIINNVRIYAPSRNGIRTWGGANCERGIITNCIISGVVGAFEALSIGNANNFVISGIINTNGMGMVGGMAYDFGFVNGSTISNLISTNSGAGGIKCNANGIWNCTFNNIVLLDCNDGLYFRIQKAIKCNFDNIVCKGNQALGTNGLVLESGCSHVNLNNIYVENAKNIGLAVDGDNITINNAQVRNSLSWGLHLAADDSHISNLQVYGQSYSKMDNVKRTTISHSSFTSGTSFGMYITGSKYFSIDYCDFINDVTAGITTDTSNNYTISHCNFIDNAGKGLDITTDSNLTITNCLFQGNTGDGIECDAYDSVIFTNNICWGDSFDDNIVRTHKIVATADNIGMVII